MSKEMLKGLIDLIDDNDTETIFKVLIRFVPEDQLYYLKVFSQSLETDNCLTSCQSVQASLDTDQYRTIQHKNRTN